jgi:hypothetical protein
VIVCCLIQPWVGHIHLNKHLDSVSLFRKVISCTRVILLLNIWIKVFILLVISCESFNPFTFTSKGVNNIFIYELLSD